VTYYLNRSGFNCPDQRVKRLIAVAAQKFISDIATEALSSARQRSQKRDRASRDRPAPAKADSKLVLTTEDLCAPFARSRLRADKHALSDKMALWIAEPSRRSGMGSPSRSRASSPTLPPPSPSEPRADSVCNRTFDTL